MLVTGSESPERMQMQPVKTPACWRLHDGGMTAKGSSSCAVELAWAYEMSSVNDRVGEAEWLKSFGAQMTLGEFQMWGIKLHGLIYTVGCQCGFAQ